MGLKQEFNYIFLQVEWMLLQCEAMNSEEEERLHDNKWVEIWRNCDENVPGADFTKNFQIKQHCTTIRPRTSNIVSERKQRKARKAKVTKLDLQGEKTRILPHVNKWDMSHRCAQTLYLQLLKQINRRS